MRRAMILVTALALSCAPSGSLTTPSDDASASAQNAPIGQQLDTTDGSVSDVVTWIPFPDSQGDLMSDADLAPGHIGAPCPDVPCPPDRPACFRPVSLTWGETPGLRCCVEVSVQQPAFADGSLAVGFIDCVLASVAIDAGSP